MKEMCVRASETRILTWRRCFFLPPSYQPPMSRRFVDADMAKVTEGVNALSVNVGAVEREVQTSGTDASGSPQRRHTDEGVQPDSPDYNDINFWKPSMNWFDK